MKALPPRDGRKNLRRKLFSSFALRACVRAVLLYLLTAYCTALLADCVCLLTDLLAYCFCLLTYFTALPTSALFADAAPEELLLCRRGMSRLKRGGKKGKNGKNQESMIQSLGVQ